MRDRRPCNAPAYRLCLWLSAFGFGMVMSAGGCQSTPQPAAGEPGVGADSLLALVQRIDASPLAMAFGEIEDLRHRRYHRTEQLAADGARIAFEERIILHESGDARVIAADSSGRFDFGYVGRFVSTRRDDIGRRSDLLQYVVPDDPAYASPRNRDAYRYRLVSDTTLHGRSVRVVRITARPGAGDRQAVRRADLYLDDADRLVGVLVERTDAALWFHEASSLFVSVDRTASDHWIPVLTRFETLLKLPFRPPQRFRTVDGYYGFGGGDVGDDQRGVEERGGDA